MKKTNKKYRKIRNKTRNRTRNRTRNITKNIARNITRNKIKYLGVLEHIWFYLFYSLYFIILNLNIFIILKYAGDVYTWPKDEKNENKNQFVWSIKCKSKLPF